MKNIFIITSLLLFITSISYSQSKLGKAKDRLSNKTNTSSSGSRSNSDSSYDTYDDDTYDYDYAWEGFATLFMELGLYVTYYGLIESPVEQENRASNAFVTKYPYQNSLKGNYSYDSGEDTNLTRMTITNRFIMENSELYGNHINADFRFLKRVSIEADYLQLWENNTFSGYNTLAIYTFLAKYHRVRTERFDAYWGIGATYVGSGVDELGFTYGIGAEYFFAKPLSLEANYNQSFINTGSMNKFNLLLNHHMDRFKLTGGYEHLKIGGIGFSTFSAGIGISF